MEKRYLTPEEKEIIDPTGRGARWIKSLRYAPPTTPPPWIDIQDTEKLYSLYAALRSKSLSNQPVLVQEWERRWDSKRGPQGGKFSLRYVEKSVCSSYANAEGSDAHTFDILRVGVNYLCRRLRLLVKRYGYPTPRHNSYEPKQGGLPLMEKKGTFLAETYMAALYRHAFLDVPGERFQRQKPRTIHMSSVLDVRYMEGELNACRDFLKTYCRELFYPWTNPLLGMYHAITDKVLAGCYSCELDYDHCDEHVSLALAEACFIPVMAELLPEPIATEFAAYVSESFHVEEFLGDYYTSGIHNGFSGQSIISDIETIHGVCLALGALIVNGVDPESCLILALGDDLSVILPSRIGRGLANSVYRTLFEEALLNGQDVNESKSELCDNHVHFCKRLFARFLPKSYDWNGDFVIPGLYPSVLSLNNIINPERPSKDYPTFLVATLQRLDGCWGSPWFVPYVQFVASHIDGTPIRVEDLPDLPDDWWSKLYGHSFRPEESYSARVIQQSTGRLLI